MFYNLHSGDKWYGAQHKAVIHCLCPVIGGPTRLPVSTFQDIINPFLQPDTKYLLFGDHAIHNTQFLCPETMNGDYIFMLNKILQNMYLHMYVMVFAYQDPKI